MKQARDIVNIFPAQMDYYRLDSDYSALYPVYTSQHFPEYFLYPMGEENIQAELYFEQRKFASEYENQRLSPRLIHGKRLDCLQRTSQLSNKFNGFRNLPKNEASFKNPLRFLFAPGHASRSSEKGTKTNDNKIRVSETLYAVRQADNLFTSPRLLDSV